MRRSVASMSVLALAMVASAASRPNVVLIVADDLGWSELGCYGGKDIPTPNIDALARSGVRFTSGYVSCPVCAPTRAGLLTGLYQQSFGLEFNPGPQNSAAGTYGLPRERATLAERLKAEGYDTGMFGKWHLGYQQGYRPPERGFDEFQGFLGGANAYLGNGNAATIYHGTQVVSEPRYLTEAFGEGAVDFIKRHKDRPFFMYVPFNAVHAPLQALDKYRERFKKITDTKRQTFAAMLSALDDQVGAITGELKRNKLDKNTLVIFISDNGGPTPQTTSNNKPLRGFKGQVYEGGVRIPYIISWPREIKGKQQIDQPVISLDVVPTAMAAVGSPVKDDLHGVNLLPFLKGQAKQNPHDELFWRMGPQHAARVGDWKLDVRSGVTELFNLKDDLSETKDLSKSNPEKLSELQQAYEKWEARMTEPKWGQKAKNNRTKVNVTIKNVMELWDSLDVNHNGKIDRGELGKPALFSRLDTNKDGSITKEEALAVINKKG